MSTLNRPPLRQLLVPVVMLLTSVSYAQPGNEATAPRLPSTLQYVSPLRTYKAYAEQPVESWQSANERVRRIGGWRAYAREIQTGKPANESRQEPVSTPTRPPGSPDKHGGRGQP